MTSAGTWLRRVLGRSEETPERLLAAARERETAGNLFEARSLLERALSSSPEHPEALLRLGHLAATERRLDAAVDYFRRASRVRASDPAPCYGLGIALLEAGRASEAEAAFRSGLVLRPDGVRMLNGLAAALIETGRLEEAEAVLDRAVREDPSDAQTHMRIARVRLEQGRLAEALDALQRAHELGPRDPVVHSALLFTMNYSGAFSARALYDAHRRFGDLQTQPVAAPKIERGEGRRLRVGYLSPDFRSHVVSAFALPILARHNRSRFEVYAYYLHTMRDAVTDGVRELSDHWRECGALPASEIAARIRADRIDILVDLAGHTIRNGLPVLALRPAPLQATYLGYPSSTGLPAVDWRLTDAKADPPGEADELHAERLARLPRSFLCYRPGPGMELGALPARARGFVTFGCFNNILKLSDSFLRVAATLLAQVPRSRLLLKDRTLGYRERREAILRVFAAAGIDPDRIELRGWAATSESHLAAYSDVDIALDSFPYNGTTTTCEALWMGVPVVTLRGDRHAARVGASLLETVELGELVAPSEQDYLRIAAGLAADLPRLDALRSGMRNRMRASPLMDEAGFVREFEDCLEGLWREKAQESPIGRAELDARWNRALDEREYGRAIHLIGAAIGEEGESARLCYMLGCALQEAGRVEEAMARYRRAVELDPGHAKASNNLGCLLETAGDIEGAARSYDQALGADPELATAYSNRGNLIKVQDPVRAEADLRRALELAPGQADLHLNLGDCLALQWRLDEALAEHRVALALAPDSARAHYCAGNVLVKLGEVDAGLESLARATRLDPSFAEAWSSLLFSLHYRRGDRADLLHEAHADWARRFAAFAASSSRPGRRSGPLRIGYVSPDFRGHSVALFLAPLLSAHDRASFRIFAYATVAQSDDVTARLRQMCDDWRDIAALPDDVAAERIRTDDLDILIDLAGHTPGARPLLFARKPAPVQVAWLGYPGTTGLRAIDYRLTDSIADPEGDSDKHATEKLWRLPQGFLCFTPAADVPVSELPALQGGRITFGSFNNLAKAGPEVLATWAALLRETPGARLMLKAHALQAASARRRLLDAFAAEGIAEARLLLLPAEKTVQAHLQRYGEVDIALDTFPYAGTTTTCEALWMGVPVVTLRGASHVARVGASLLSRVGLPALVADSRQAYVAAAKALAGDLPALAAQRRGLRERMERSSLMDAAGFARSVEAAYREMCAGLEPLRLHIGGKETRDGWKIFNAQAGPGVDFLGNCADLGQFADGSVGEIYASHVVEHLGYQSDLPRALKEFHRVLRPGGVARISVPDFERLSRIFLAPGSTLDERFRSMRMVFGGQTDEHDFHRVGLSEEFLTQYLLHAGFTRVERVERFELFDDMSRLEMAGQQISLNVVAYK